MAIIVADCPRCRAHNMTFDVSSSVAVGMDHGWLRTFEGFCVCRNCGRGTIFFLRVSNYDFSHSSAGPRPETHNGSLMPFIDKPTRFVSIRDMGKQSAPEFAPDDVGNAYNQGATCVAVECWDAAAAMFRKSVDLATRPLLPSSDEEGLNSRTRRDLGLRLPWLFKTKRLPNDLQDLSTCIREDGNDGAHSGSLEKADAEDLLDFTKALLERLYTEPERLRQAAERREARRNAEKS